MGKTIRTRLVEEFVLEGGDPSFVGERRPVGLAALHRGEFPRFVTTT